VQVAPAWAARPAAPESVDTRRATVVDVFDSVRTGPPGRSRRLTVVSAPADVDRGVSLVRIHSHPDAGDRHT
jgi:hypothetical protein